MRVVIDLNGEHGYSFEIIFKLTRRAILLSPVQVALRHQSLFQARNEGQTLKAHACTKDHERSDIKQGSQDMQCLQ